MSAKSRKERRRRADKNRYTVRIFPGTRKGIDGLDERQRRAFAGRVRAAIERLLAATI